MCKYTIYHLECGHRAEDHVDSSQCTHYRQTTVACDRDNPANHARVTVKSRDRTGMCNNCGRLDFEAKELQAMKRELDLAKKQSLVEAEERKRAAEAHERKMEMDARAEWQRVHGEKASTTDQPLKTRSPQKASKDFQRPAQPRKRDSHQEPISQGPMKSSGALSSPIAIPSSIPPPPPMPSTTTVTTTQSAPTTVPTPPATPAKVTTPQQSPSTNAPKLKTTDYTLPAFPSQEYDRFTINGRKMPVHASQKMEFKDSKQAFLPTAPAPVGRLNGIIKPADIPSFSHLQSSTGQTATAGHKPSVTRKPSNLPPVPAKPADNDELHAKLMARRKWEEELDDTADVIITPSESVSSHSTGSSRGWTEVTVITAGQVQPSGEAATVLGESVLDQKRRAGWR